MENIRKQNTAPEKGKKISVLTLTMMGLLTAITVVLYFLSMSFTIGMFNITLTLVPIVVGAALYGWKAGGWLGLVFGVTVLVTGGATAFLQINIPGTILTVILKGVLAGVIPALVYSLIAKKNATAAAFTAGILSPIVNTGIFFLGCLVFFFPTIREWGAASGFDSVWTYMFLGLGGINFLIEFGINLVLGPAIVEIVRLSKKMLRSSK